MRISYLFKMKYFPLFICIISSVFALGSTDNSENSSMTPHEIARKGMLIEKMLK